MDPLKNEPEDIKPIVTAPETPALKTPEPSIEVPEPPKKSHKKLILVIVSVLIVVGIAAAVVFFLTRTRETPAATAPTPTTTAPEPTAGYTSDLSKFTDPTELLVEQSKQGLKGTIADKDKDGNKLYSAPQYIPSGYAFYAPSSGVNFGFRDSGSVDTIKADYASVTKVIVDKGLKALKNDFKPRTFDDELEYSLYTSSTTVCYVGRYETMGETDDDITASVYTSCALIKDYVTAVGKLQIFYDAYNKSPERIKGKPGFAGVTIKDSKTTNYKLGTTQMIDQYYGLAGGFAGLFYQTPDKVWHYFKGTQSELVCSDYNTTDIKKAYLGVACYNETTKKQSSVSL